MLTLETMAAFRFNFNSDRWRETERWRYIFAPLRKYNRAFYPGSQSRDARLRSFRFVGIFQSGPRGVLKIVSLGDITP